MARTSVDEHAAHIARLLAFTPTVDTIGLDAGLGRVTAGPIVSPVDLPLFRNSQMDGFAVRAADVAHPPTALPIVGEIAARPCDPGPLAAGAAVRIMTGAVVPEGADAVVPVEDTTSDDAVVTVLRARAPGEYVRERGSDVRAGEELLPAGLLLGSRHLAALAAAGITTVDVRARVRVAIITTGSELIEPGGTPVLGQIFDSNGTALDAAVRAAGALVAHRVHVADDHGAMLAALETASGGADLIVTSGGISMGDHEVVRETLEPLGATVTTIAMQPGGPQATAVFAGVPVVCFPGNPVSTQVSFEVFLAPLLRRAAGLPPARRERRELSHAVTSVAGKRQFLRGRTVPGNERLVEVVSGASSHLVAGLAASELLIDIGEAVSSLHAGAEVETWML
jgi:molybdopterin molybdotransferase